jgi:thiol-disulfide isomerase/thioredoxin
MTRLCALAATLLAAAAAPAAEPLTIGSPAPKFEVPTFLLGEPVKELKRGTVHVIEFSGTRCAPCVKYMPLLTDLQKKYPNVVVISVYPEPEKDVREYLPKHQDKIGYRVVVDPEGRMNAAWMEAAYQGGIPCAFVVDGAGKIAWIGNAASVADPLAKIVAGTFDPTADVMRVKFEQGVVRRVREAQRREEQASAEHRRINQLVIAKKYAEALSATEAAIKEYADTTDGIQLFLGAKFYILAKQPTTKDTAVELGLELALAAKLSSDTLRCLNTAARLINAASDDDPKKRDVRLLDLAVALLNDTDAHLKRYSPGSSPSQLASDRIAILWRLGRAHHFRGDSAAAVRAAEELIALTRERKPEAGQDPEEFRKQQDADIARYTADLARYKKAAESQPKYK